MKIENEWRYYDKELHMPFPWYTRPCLEWLNQQSLLHKHVWEYGMGDSTEWYDKKGAWTRGVDSNSLYSQRSKFGMYEKTLYRYITAIEINGPYDIVVIDGDFRDECTKFALEFLKPGGYLIIDNYKQPSVQADWPLTEKLIEEMDVKYFKEPGHADWQTIVVTK